MTYRSEGVPLGSVAVYRPGRLRPGDTAMSGLEASDLVEGLDGALKDARRVLPTGYAAPGSDVRVTRRPKTMKWVGRQIE